MADGKDESQNKKEKEKRISYSECFRCGIRKKGPDGRTGPQSLCDRCKYELRKYGM